MGGSDVCHCIGIQWHMLPFDLKCKNVYHLILVVFFGGPLYRKAQSVALSYTVENRYTNVYWSDRG